MIGDSLFCSPSSPALLPRWEKRVQVVAIPAGGDIRGVGDAWFR